VLYPQEPIFLIAHQTQKGADEIPYDESALVHDNPQRVCVTDPTSTEFKRRASDKAREHRKNTETQYPDRRKRSSSFHAVTDRQAPLVKKARVTNSFPRTDEKNRQRRPASSQKGAQERAWKSSCYLWALHRQICPHTRPVLLAVWPFVSQVRTCFLIASLSASLLFLCLFPPTFWNFEQALCLM
jgi:hypothetical protein